ncbi:MAG: hypothetical protein AAF745_17630 [Planctomycetota bacterium]
MRRRLQYESHVVSAVMINPYEPSHTEPEPASAWMRLAHWIFEAPPVRSTPERTSQWLLDSLVALIVIFAGFAAAGLIAEHLLFLRSMAYPTGLAIGCLPFVLWLNYCQSKHFMLRGYFGMVCVAFVISTLQSGLIDVLLLPLAIAITLTVLPIEIAIGKIVLAMLPGSSARDHG